MFGNAKENKVIYTRIIVSGNTLKGFSDEVAAKAAEYVDL